MKRNYGTRLLLCAMVLMSLTMAGSTASMAQIAVGISVRIGPPALPVYAQPICPGGGYFWTPGYWGWNDEGGYYWVPGTWVVAPVGLLWTPGYWGWGGGLYAWHGGYWGPHVGFYGGINYGFGYGGVGFGGGEWRGGAFYYNRSVSNVNVTNVTNVYNRTVVVNENHVAFNGGEGGVAARPTAQEEAYGREPHQAAIAAQVQQEHAASQNRASFASENHGRPAVAATARPGEFSGRGVVEAKAAGAEYRAPAMSPKEARGPSTPATGGAARGNATPNNNGFHSFTPPNKNNTAGGDRAGSNNTGSSANGGSNNNDRGAAGSNGARPAEKFTPPSSSHSASSPSSAPSPSGQARSEANTSRAPSESRPQSAGHTSSTSKASAPQSSAPHKSAAKPAEHKSSPPKSAPHESERR